MAYRYNKFHFFNENGDELDFKYDSVNHIWKGSMHLPKVSVNLFENNSLYVLEEFEDLSGNTIYGIPHTDQTLGSNNGIETVWKDKDEKAFTFFTVDSPFNERPIFEKRDSFTFTLPYNPTDAFNPTTGRLITANNIPSPCRIAFAINSPDENSYVNWIQIKDANGVFVEVEIYGETVGEDERFPVLLANFGEYITEREEFIFRNSDINEDFPNFDILNKKRKELLIELHNIKPYFAGYKGIINIIKYFGYYELKLKEYWKNLDTGKFVLQEIRLNEENALDKKNYFLEAPYQKTSSFGLFYEINRDIPNEFDDHGIPLTENVSVFSNEEILIKLFGLKNYIRERGIGGVSRIVDIIGEAVYYNRYSINNWTDKTDVLVYDYHVEPKFTSTEKLGYIQDLRPYLNDYSSCPLPINTVGSDPIILSDYPNCFLGYFDPFNQSEPEYLDEPEIPVGYPLFLLNKSFDITWADINVLWKKFADVVPVVTWENIGHLNFFEIEWVVSKQSNPDDPRTFEYSKRGKISDIGAHTVILPYNGIYNVTLILYGWNNIISKHTEQSFIQVELKEADFICWFKYRDPNLQVWATNTLSWKDIFSSWGGPDPIFDNSNIQIKNDDIKYRSFNLVNYVDVVIDGIPNVGIKDFKWADYPNITWQDLMYVRWKDLIFERDKLARFLITKMKANGFIQINDDEIQIPDDYNINDFVRLTNYLASQIFPNFVNREYTARPMNVTPSFVDVVATDYGYSGNVMIGGRDGVEFKDDKNPTWADLQGLSWAEIPIKWSNMAHFSHVKGKQEPYTFDNTQIFKSNFVAPMMIPIFMTIDNSKMSGKTKAIWLIKNQDTDEVLLNHESLFLNYRFDKAGDYTIKVTIEDTNGNVNDVVKERTVKILRGKEFLNWKYLHKNQS